MIGVFVGRLAALLSVLILAAAPAVAAPPTGVEMQAAADTLASKVNAAKKSGGDVPRLRDSADALLIRTAFSHDGLVSMPPDMASVLPVCGALQTAFSAMVDWTESGGVTRFAAYQDELTLGLMAGDMCVKRLFRSSEAFFTKLPLSERTAVRRNGFKRMQDGAQLVIQGMLGEAGDQALSQANRTLIVTSLLEDADTISAGLTPPQRAAVRAKIQAAAQKADPAIRARLMDLDRVYQRTDCGPLCTFSSEQ